MSTLSRCCKMEGCEKQHLSRGFCGAHYAQWSRGSIGVNGETLRGVRPRGPNQEGTCKVVGCVRTDLAGFNMCGRHWQQTYEGIRLPSGEQIREARGEGSCICEEPGCGKPTMRKGLCRKHSWRARKDRNGPGTGAHQERGDGYIINAEGYRSVCVARLYPQALETSWGDCKYAKARYKWALEHRLVMELHLGRALGKREIVHHKDGHRQNNTLGNLELTRVGEHIPGHVVSLEEAILFLEQHVHYGMSGDEVLYDRLSFLMERLTLPIAKAA